MSNIIFQIGNTISPKNDSESHSQTNPRFLDSLAEGLAEDVEALCAVLAGVGGTVVLVAFAAGTLPPLRALAEEGVGAVLTRAPMQTWVARALVDVHRAIHTCKMDASRL
jgi:hypothetical protein